MFMKIIIPDAFSSPTVNWTKHERIIDNKEVMGLGAVGFCVVEKDKVLFVFGETSSEQ